MPTAARIVEKASNTFGRTSGVRTPLSATATTTPWAGDLVSWAETESVASNGKCTYQVLLI